METFPRQVARDTRTIVKACLFLLVSAFSKYVVQVIDAIIKHFSRLLIQKERAMHYVRNGPTLGTTLPVIPTKAKGRLWLRVSDPTVM